MCLWSEDFLASCYRWVGFTMIYYYMWAVFCWLLLEYSPRTSLYLPLAWFPSWMNYLPNNTSQISIEMEIKSLSVFRCFTVRCWSKVAGVLRILTVGSLSWLPKASLVQTALLQSNELEISLRFLSCMHLRVSHRFRGPKNGKNIH